MDEKIETVNLNVLIADRTYPLKALQTDEEGIKSAVKLVNEMIKDYQSVYAGKDKQDYMAMCLLKLAVENIKSEQEITKQYRLLEDQIARIEEYSASIAS